MRGRESNNRLVGAKKKRENIDLCVDFGNLNGDSEIRFPVTNIYVYDFYVRSLLVMFGDFFVHVHLSDVECGKKNEINPGD